jgi:hypothetical protein
VIRSQGFKKGGETVKKVFFVALATIFALSLVLVGCTGEGETAPEAIKVGLVRDLTGVLAFYDQMSGGPVYRAFTEYINDGGGIPMSEYDTDLDIELKIRQYDPMTPGDLGTQTTALITQDKVNFIWGAPGTTTIYTQASICNAYGIILMTLEGGATDMIRDSDKLPSWPYVWVNLSFSDWYQVPTLYQILKENGVAEPKAYVVYIDNEHGHEYLEVTQEIFGAGNVTEVGHDQYLATQSDMDTIVQNAVTALNTTPYDIFCAWTYMPYLGYLVQSFETFGFNPPAIAMGPGATGGSFLLTFGADTMEGISGFAVANNKSSVAPEAVTMSFADMYDLIMPQASGGFPPAFTWDVWADPVMWAGLEMWAQAVESVGSLEVGYSALVRDALAGFDGPTTGHYATTVMGNCWYHVFGDGLGGGVIDYQAMPGQICQWQDGYTEIVGFDGIDTDAWAVPPIAIGDGAPTTYPKYDVTAEFEYPMTNAWGWLP